MPSSSMGSSSGGSSAKIETLLKQTTHFDKDERYMATSDLCEILKRHAANDNSSSSSNDFSIDAATERHICSAVLKLLDDSSNDVQTIAVKTLGVLLTTVHLAQAKQIADRLRTQVLDTTKGDLRDVYAIGLRTLVQTIPIDTMGDPISATLVGPLMEGIRQHSTATSSSSSKTTTTTTATIKAKHDHADITLACLDVLMDLLSRFGDTSVHLQRHHESLLHVVFLELASEKDVVRKRASNTLGVLSSVLSDALLIRLTENLLNQIDMAEGIGKRGKLQTKLAHEKNKSSSNSSTTTGTTKTADTRALLRTMCKVASTVGHRLGQDLIDRIVPIFLRFCDPEDVVAEDGDNDDDVDDYDEENKDEAATALANELRESCFAGFESFILKCPDLVKPHLARIIVSALAYMSYDPNYSYDDDDDDDEGDEQMKEDGDNDEEEEEEEEEDDEYMDDDDEYLDDEDDDDSWKVRRSAIRTLAAVVQASKRDPSPLWTDEYEVSRNKKKTGFAGALVKRFKEREENCRVDVIDCFKNLLSVSIDAAASGGIVLAVEGKEKMDTGDEVVQIAFTAKYTPAIVKACEKQLEAKKGGERSKSSALALLAKLATAPGGLGGQDQILSVFCLLKTILRSSGDGSSGTSSHHDSSSSKALVLDALALVDTMLLRDENNPTFVKNALLNSIMEELCQSVKEDWYKVIAAALGVIAKIPHVVIVGGSTNEEKNKIAAMIFEALEPRLAAHDVDQEIKECALNTNASLLSTLHSNLSKDQQSRLLSLLLERLRNDTTRLASIKALTVVSTTAEPQQNSELLDMSSVLADLVGELASLLRQQNRGLKQNAMMALNVLIQNHGSDEATLNEQFDRVLVELAPLVSDADLHICHLSLLVAKSILTVSSSCGNSVTTNVLPTCITLAKSSLLQNPALDSLLAFLEQIVLGNAMEFNELMSMLQQMTDTGSAKKHTVSNVAKCMAVITAATTDEYRNGVLSDLVGSLKNTKGDAKERQLAFLVSGDLGRRVDLGKTESVATKLRDSYLQAFKSSSEEIKHAAAYALGCAASGSISTFLPVILETLGSGGDSEKYLILSSLRELIRCQHEDGKDDVVGRIEAIMPYLIKHCSDQDEGVRTMIAECLGSLTVLRPVVVLPELEKLVNEHVKKAGEADNLVLTTVATAIKIAIGGKVDPSALSPYMASFLKLLQEEDLVVRNASLLFVYSAVHHAPQLVVPLMQEQILPVLYELTKLTLKRVVDLGPFKHTVDDALPLRKSSLSIFATALEKCPSSLDIPFFMPLLAKLCQDVEDVQLQAHQVVISCCQRHPKHTLVALEFFVEPLTKTLNRKIGQKTGTELERSNEWTKSALRVAVHLNRLDGARSVVRFAKFMDVARENPSFKSMFESVENER